MMYKIGLSSCGFPLTEENFRALRDAGIEAVEISLPSEEYAHIRYDAVAELARRYGITLWSFHLPFAPFDEIDPSSEDAAVRQRTLQYFTTLIEQASAIGIRLFVIHASGEPIPDDRRAARMQCAKASLRILAEVAARHGAILAVEDLPRTCLGRDAADMQELLSAHPALRACLDTNHLLTSEVTDLIAALGERIVTLHVSDYDRLNERHWLPGEGCIPWPQVLEKLAQVGYNGPFLYEVGLACPATILRDRDLTFSDIRDNAIALFAGRTPPLRGTPKPGLGMWG